MQKKSVKVLSFILSALMLISVIPVVASADTSGYYTYTVSNGKATITRASVEICGDVEIPETLGGYPVTSIGEYAFFKCEAITAVEIPDTVTSIGEKAFRECIFLTSVSLGEGLKSINDEAFAFSSLIEIYIPENVTFISDSAFFACMYLKKIDVDPENPNFSNDGAGVLFNKSKTRLKQFPAGSSFNYYEIPSSVKYIEGGAFAFSSLKEIVIPFGVRIIGSWSFFACSNLTSIEIPASVAEIKGYAFGMCNALTEITIPRSVEYIGAAALHSCSSLGRIIILNPECKLLNQGEILPPKVPLYGYVGSTTEQYAKANSTPFYEIHDSCLHAHVAYVTEPTCQKTGYTTYKCHCGDMYVSSYTEISDHRDADGSYSCDWCGKLMKTEDSNINNCSHICHQSGFMGFIWKVINFFSKLFNTNPICECGAAHY